MNCQQKSGVFLNIDCQNPIKNTCSNCEKEVCKTHSHLLEATMYCEDCYWEAFLLTTEMKPDNTTRRHDDDIIIASSPTMNTRSGSGSSSDPDGFGGGFGGGQFSGGGAGGSWTEGDMQSLADTDAQGGFLTDGDDTFFYS
nr:hypothetical protein [uncultured Psychroserpens sp.]